MGSWEVRLTWLDCSQRSYIWIFGWTLREDVRLACAQAPELFFDHMYLFNCQRKNKKIMYANVCRNTFNDGDSQTSPLPIFPEGVGTSVHRLYISRGKGDHYLIQTRYKDLFSHYNLILRKL